MSLIDLRRRLERLQAARNPEAPTLLLTDRAIGDVVGDAEAADALANWRSWVARGKATVANGVPCLTRPEMTEAEWTAAHVTMALSRCRSARPCAASFRPTVRGPLNEASS